MENLSTAPTLTTGRLILRGPERSDLPEFTRFMTSAPSMVAQGESVTADQAWFGFLTGIGHWHWHWHGFGFFTLVEQRTDQPVGRVGLLKHFNWPDVELAWHLFEGAERKGYATEAAMAVKTWASEELGVRSALQLHRPDERSIAGRGEEAWRRHGRNSSPARTRGGGVGPLDGKPMKKDD